MKNIIAIRHAETARPSIGMKDEDRSLTDRGEQEAEFMAALLKYSGLVPDLVVCSHARRAIQTAWIFADRLQCNRVKVDPRLYLRGTQKMLVGLTELEESSSRIILVGHNPDITGFVNALCAETAADFPTCAVASMTFPVQTWAETGEGTGVLTFNIYPEMFKLP